MKSRLIAASTVALVGLAPIAAATLNSSVAGASTTNYTPVPLDLANLIANSGNTGIKTGVHFEQTVVDSSGNYWTDTTDGKLIEISGASPHIAVGYLNVGGSSLYDAVANGNTIYLINQQSPLCPVEIVDVAPSNMSVNTSTLQISLKNGPTCVTPASGNFGSTTTTSIATDGTNVYFAQRNSTSSNATSTLWEIKSGAVTATPFPLSVSVDSAITVADGYLFAQDPTYSNIYQFQLNGMSSSTPLIPVETYAIPGASKKLGDFQYVSAYKELWFVREFVGQVGFIPVVTSGANKGGTVYSVQGTPNSAAESMTLDPNTNNLWIASGNVNGSSYKSVVFGYFNPSSLPSGSSISPVLVLPPTSSSLSADDFVLSNGAPTYFDNSPLNALTKTDSAGGKVLDNQSFNFVIQPSVASNSPIPGYGGYQLIDPMPTGITATSFTTSSQGTSVTTPWSCQLSPGQSTAGGTGTLTCNLRANAPIAAGTQLPPITITAIATGPVGTPIQNTATLSNATCNDSNVCTVVAPPVSASDSITPITTPVTPAAPTVSLSKTATQPTVSPGGTDSYTISGSFTGLITATATVTDNIPAGLSVNGTPTITGSGFASANCNVAGSVVTCTLVPPAAGVSSPAIGSITVPVSVASTATGSIVNTATVSDPGNNISPVSASATISVVAPTPNAPSSVSPTPNAPSSGSPTPSPVTSVVSVPTAPSSASGTATVVTVPAVHTGEPWRAASYWWLIASLGVAGVILVFPRGSKSRGTQI